MTTQHIASITTARGLRISLCASTGCCISISTDNTASYHHFTAADVVALRGLLNGAVAHFNQAIEQRNQEAA